MTATHKVPRSPCPCCGASQDMASNAGGTMAPTPGAIAICVRCGGVAIFASDLRKRAAVAADFNSMDDETMAGILEAREAILALKGSRREATS